MSALKLNHRYAFTLLELILTLAMSVVLMVLIGGAIQFYGRDMNLRDMDIRQTQLAAALLQMIEDDLRSTIYGEPADMAAQEALLVASSGGQTEDAVDLAAAGIDLDPNSNTSPMEDDTTMDLITSASVLESPGMIGGQTSIQIDLSRLPRLEEYQLMIDAVTGNLQDVSSDVKTVAYFVQAPGTIAGVDDELQSLGDTSGESDLVSGGLVRRSLDRSATVHASSTGSMTMLSQTGDLLAPEVTSIEFSYWDGITWLTYWNSDDRGQLPMAVKVKLAMSDSSGDSTNDRTETDARTFTHVVRLPMAQPADETVEAGETTEDFALSEAGS